MSSRILWLITSLAVLCGKDVHADPESWLWFGTSIPGAEAGGRFGAELACSRGVLDSGKKSLVAVGAPHAANGEGRVYLYDPLVVSSPLQVLGPAASNVVKQFGAAIQFIDDVNGDGVDDLLIGAPGSSADTEGRLYAFTSLMSSGLLNNRPVEYTLCGEVSGPVGFAQELQSLRVGGGSSGSNVVVGNPRSGRIASFLVFADNGGICQFAATTDFFEARSLASQFGASLTQVGSSTSATSGGASIVVAAPGEGVAGLLYERRFADSMPPMVPERAGSVVSGRYNSSTYVSGVPSSNNNRGAAFVYGADTMSGAPLCEVSNAVADYSGTFGSNVHHLGGSFLGFFWAAREIVVVRHSETLTGGALSLVGVMEDGCIAPLMVNNCQLDPLQEQGVALAGGADCQVYLGGRVQHLLASGSPGWSGGQGRVDIAFEEGILDIPLSCPVDDGAALPVGTSTPLPMTPAVSPEIPAVTPTVTNSWTTEPVITVVPSVTPSGYPTAVHGLEIATPVVSQGNPQGGELYSPPTTTPQVEVPIVVAPGSGGLSAPEVIVRAGQVEVRMPVVVPQLTGQQRMKVIRQLQRKGRLSQNKAAQLLSDPDNLSVTYIVHYTEVPAPRQFALIQSAYAQDSRRRATKARQIRTRLNNVTLRNLRPGATFKVWYTVEVSMKKPRRVLGITQPSAVTTFRVS